MRQRLSSQTIVRNDVSNTSIVSSKPGVSFFFLVNFCESSNLFFMNTYRSLSSNVLNDNSVSFDNSISDTQMKMVISSYKTVLYFLPYLTKTKCIGIMTVR